MIAMSNDYSSAQGFISTASESFGTPSPTEAGKKVLIIDDDPVILKRLSVALRSRGYQVTTATDGSEALAQARQQKPDLLIVDVVLGLDPIGCGATGWDGFQIARWIRGSSCVAPIIMISGADKPEYRSEAVAVGAGSFLSKPINTGELLATVASLVSGQEPVQSLA